MSRKFGQGRFKVEACVNVVIIIFARGIDDILIDHTELHSDILEGWWMEYRQELGDVSNGGFITKLFHYRQVPQLLPIQWY